MMKSDGSPLVVAVDDKPANLQLVGSLLGRTGYRVALARSGAQLLQFLARQSPDLILLDVMMPGLDGYEVCQRLQLDPSTRDIPVIFLTARADTTDVVRGFEVGGVDYIAKPFEAAELLARVRTHVALHRAKREIATLRGILPICASCKSIRNDEGYWERVDAYISRHTEVQFSHGLCEDCVQRLYGDEDWFDDDEESPSTSRPKSGQGPP